MSPLVVGHRGAMGSFPENTLLSFDGAADLGAEWVELDVHQSRDGALVVIHDQRVERTTNGSGRVADDLRGTLDDPRRHPLPPLA